MFLVNIHEAKTHLSRLIRRVISGEEVVIARGNKPLVKLVPLEGKNPTRRIGSAKGIISIHKDFNEALDDFQDYLK
jgi:prevent-host-death family protein